MKELMLVLYMCSAVADTCMPPFKWPVRFVDDFSCMVQGYEEAAKKTIEIGKQEINQHKIFIKFDCLEVDPITPPPKPKITT